MKPLPPEILDIIRDTGRRAVDNSTTAVAEIVERELQRRRDEACLELVAMQRRVDRLRAEAKKLHKARLLARAVKGIQLANAKRRRGKAKDYCAALEGSG